MVIHFAGSEVYAFWDEGKHESAEADTRGTYRLVRSGSANSKLQNRVVNFLMARVFRKEKHTCTPVNPIRSGCVSKNVD